MMLGRPEVRKSWPILAQHFLFELRECPHCGQPAIRWKAFDEIKMRVLTLSFRLAGGNRTMVARRLRMSRRSIYDHLPPTGRGGPTRGTV